MADDKPDKRQRIVAGLGTSRELDVVADQCVFGVPVRDGDSRCGGWRQVRQALGRRHGSCRAATIAGTDQHVGVKEDMPIAGSQRLVRGAADRLQTHQMLDQMGRTLKLVIMSDTTCARRICSLSGSGKLKHLK